MKRIVSVLVVLLWVMVSQAQVKSSSVEYVPKKFIPTNLFFENDAMADIRISRDARNIAYIGPFKDFGNLYVRGLNGGEPRLLTQHTERNVLDYRWVDARTILYLFDIDGSGNRTLFMVRTDSGESYQITGEGVDAKFLQVGPIPKEVAYFMMKPAGAKGYDVWTVRLEDGVITRVMEGTAAITEWFVSPDGARMLASSVDQGRVQILALDNQTGNLLKNFNYPRGVVFKPVGFDPGSKTAVLAISNIGRKNAELVSFDFVSGKEVKVLFAKEESDVISLRMNWQMAKPVGAYYTGKSSGNKMMDPVYDAYQKVIKEKSVFGEDFVIADMDEANNVFILKCEGDRRPVSFWMYNHANRELKSLYENPYPANPEYLSPQRMNTFTNRNGSQVQFMETRSPHAGKLAPTIIIIPEWPWERVNPNNFYRVQQCLANNGFFVVTMDFLASQETEGLVCSQGYAQWGKLVQENVIDLASHLIKSGESHPDKIFLVGASFGANIASSALAARKDLFRAGVFINGIFDVPVYLDHEKSVDPIHSLKYINVSDEDTDLLKSHNASFATAKFSNPLLFAYSSYDQLVPPSLSESAATTVVHNGGKVEMVYLDDNHLISSKHNYVRLYEDIVAFLKRVVGTEKDALELKKEIRDSEQKFKGGGQD